MPSPIALTGILFPFLFAIAFLGGHNQKNRAHPENGHVIVTGENLPASDNNSPAIRSVSPDNAAGQGGGKTIRLAFERSGPDIVMLMVTSNLSGLPVNHPGWHVNRNSLVCSGSHIDQEKCHLKLTYIPTQERPESAIHISYEYLVNGQKKPKTDKIRVML